MLSREVELVLEWENLGMNPCVDGAGRMLGGGVAWRGGVKC